MTMCRLPHWLTARSTISLTPPSMPTSACMASAVPPLPRMVSTFRCAAAWSRSATSTRAPSLASRREVAPPMPSAPPVTIATLSFNRCMRRIEPGCAGMRTCVLMTTAAADQPNIIHADLDAFYASVEQRDDPRLRGQPTIVGAGIVLSASYEARATGVYTPMGLNKALLLCPAAVVVGPRFEAYSAASKAVFEIFESTTPLVEGISIDEAFLDVHGLEKLSGSSTEIAARLR